MMETGIKLSAPADLITNPKNTAKAKLANIPAEATQNVPTLRSSGLKLFGLYGTGFAHPIKKGAFVMTRRSGIIIEPYKSRCFRGFKVNLPAYLAVVSPYFKAA